MRDWRDPIGSAASHISGLMTGGPRAVHLLRKWTL